jgi:hypothetical protein
MNESVIAELTAKVRELTIQERIDIEQGINLKAAIVIQKMFPGLPFAEDLLRQKSGS